MAKSEESADKQLQLMNTEVRSINVPEGYQRQETSDQPLILAQVDHRPAGSPVNSKNATCHYCQKRGHLKKVCLSKSKKKNVHEIEATSPGASESVPDPSQSSCDHMF